MSVHASWTRVVFVPVVLLLSFIFDPRLCICEKNATYVFWSSLPLIYLLDNERVKLYLVFLAEHNYS